MDVYFVSKFRYESNLPPFERTGQRWVPSSNIVAGVLDEYFEGPGSTERFSFGWIAIYDGFTGYSRVEIEDGIARVYLTGTCAPASTSYDIGDILIYNLKQFPEIQFVKIYDANGVTTDPFGSNDSVPACLQ